MSWNLAIQTSWNPLGHTGPVTGLLYLYVQRERNEFARIYIYIHEKQHTRKPTSFHLLLSLRKISNTSVWNFQFFWIPVNIFQVSQQAGLHSLTDNHVSLQTRHYVKILHQDKSSRSHIKVSCMLLVLRGQMVMLDTRSMQTKGYSEWISAHWMNICSFNEYLLICSLNEYLLIEWISAHWMNICSLN